MAQESPPKHRGGLLAAAIRGPGTAWRHVVGRGRSCRLKFLWTVNLGAGLGAVSGARREAPRSPPPEPANPDNAPITRRRPSLPQPARTRRRSRPIILRRDDTSSPLQV